MLSKQYGINESERDNKGMTNKLSLNITTPTGCKYVACYYALHVMWYTKADRVYISVIPNEPAEPASRLQDGID